MARADLLCDIIKYGLNSDVLKFRKAAEAICAEERAKQHGVLATRIEEMLRVTSRVPVKEPVNHPVKNGNGDASMINR
jgi:hypothetical protein